MNHQIRCPHCGTGFVLDESEYALILKQVRDREFDQAVAVERSRLEKEMDMRMQVKFSEYNQQFVNMQRQLDQANFVKDKAVEQAVAQQNGEVMKLRHQLNEMRSGYELRIQQSEMSHQAMIKAKDEEIAYYKDFKARQSTKMIGESLEQFCLSEFNRVRMMAFPGAYFEKDNDARMGSKGDFIFREYQNGVELLSIMFEMKNESDTTATKHKNEDFFKELNKDRNQKKCEYAVLVSMLESDNDFYNTGIVDVSYRYPKMYVIRPQFFIPIIGLLRNMALGSLAVKMELNRVKQRDLDITKLEESLMGFKANISRNYELASNQFNDAITEIDKSISHLEKVKKSLLSSERNLRLLNDKTEKLSLPVTQITVD